MSCVWHAFRSFYHNFCYLVYDALDSEFILVMPQNCWFLIFLLQIMLIRQLMHCLFLLIQWHNLLLVSWPSRLSDRFFIEILIYIVIFCIILCNLDGHIHSLKFEFVISCPFSLEKVASVASCFVLWIYLPILW